ncbi:hypothetical protein Hanom_Chr00s002150g01692711 [Helianthus anomalus]
MLLLKTVCFFNRSELSFLSKLLFWYLRFVYFCHFIPKLISFASGSLWFQFYCHFGPKVKSGHIYFLKSCYFVLYLRGKMVISFLFYLKLLLKGLCNRFKFWTKKNIYIYIYIYVFNNFFVINPKCLQQLLHIINLHYRHSKHIF